LVGVNGGATNGTVTMNVDGTYTYTPNANFNGSDLFTYQVCDLDNECSSATVTITVISVNDIPVAVTDVNSTNEDTAVKGDVSPNDTPSGDEGNTWTLVGVNGGATNGTVTMNTDGTFTYTPNANFNGSDVFTYQVCDVDNDCSNANVTITINAVNNPPVASDDINSTFANMPVSGNLLTNDTDPEGNPLTVIIIPVSNPTYGTVVINPDGTYTYTPNTGYTGTDTFQYQVCDNANPPLCDVATVSITIIQITAGNDAPVASNDAYKGTLNSAVNGNVAGNDFDPDANLDPNSFVLVGPAPGNGTLTFSADGNFIFVPSPGFTGQVIFTYQVCDLGIPVLCDQATVTIDILPDPSGNSTFVTDDSYFGDEDTPITGNVLGNDYDPQGNTQTVITRPVSIPAHGTLVLNSDGTFIYTSVPNYNGPDQFVYAVCDNGTPQACTQATVYLNVIPVNDPPVAADDFNTTLANVLVSGNLLANDSDPEGNPLTVNTTPVVNPVHGTVIINPDGTYTYTPNGGYTGTDTFQYQVCDNATPALCDVATVLITITPGNDPPLANKDTYLSDVNVIILGTVGTNDSDPNGNLDPDSFTLTGPAPENGTLTLNADGTFIFVPSPGFIGNVTFIYQVCDLGPPVLCDTAIVNIHIKGRIEDLVIYNLVTPNGDNKNDTWQIRGIEDYPDNTILVFNRWGDRVRDFSRYDNKNVFWDGTNNKGEILPSGTYYYLLTIKGMGSRTGWVYINGKE